MNMKYCFPVYEFRPLDESRRMLRYNSGSWIPDDGEFDICFITDDKLGAPICYYVDLPYRKNLLWSWAKNNQWGSYVSKHPSGNAWHYMTKDGTEELNEDWNRNEHPNISVIDVGMSKLSSKHGVANGSGVEFQIGNEYISRGLVRERSSKNIVEFPKNFKCIYCGNHDIFKEDDRLVKTNKS